MPNLVTLELSIEVLRDVRHAAKTALAKHIRKSYSAPNVDHRVSHQIHAERLRTFLSAIDAQVGDIKHGR